VKKKNLLAQTLKMIVLGIAIYFAVMTIFRPFVVSGPSMEPTLYDGDILLCSKIDIESDIGYGDIVIVKTLWWKRIVKRVVGVPGDTVNIIDGYLYINGTLSPYQYELIENPGALDYPLVLGSDEYFVMGDNRNNSNDSRDIGAVSRDSLLFKVKSVKSFKSISAFRG
jgi:signal peptidase I